MRIRVCPRCKQEVAKKFTFCPTCTRLPVLETPAEERLRMIREQTAKETAKAIKRIENRVQAFNMNTTGCLTLDHKIRTGKIRLACEGCGLNLSTERTRFCDGCHPKCRCGKLTAFETDSSECLNCLQVEKRLIEYLACDENVERLREIIKLAGFKVSIKKGSK